MNTSRYEETNKAICYFCKKKFVEGDIAQSYPNSNDELSSTTFAHKHCMESELRIVREEKLRKWEQEEIKKNEDM